VLDSKALRIRLGHESLDVTLAYLKGKDAESGRSAGTCEQQQPGAVCVEYLLESSPRGKEHLGD